MDQILKDRVAVVTGAGRGLGRAIALEMAKQGAKVVVNDFGGEKDGIGASHSPADEVVAEIKQLGREAVANYDSVVTAEGGESIINSAIGNFGKIDILINNAGIVRDHFIWNMTKEDWDLTIKVHLYGHFHCTKPACILMREQRSGRIVNMVSLSAFGNPGQSNYGAAKAGILGFTRCVARDMGRYGVTCNAVIPTAGTRISRSPELKIAWQKRADQGDPMAIKALEGWDKRFPEDNSPLVAYLASKYASNINGYLFYVREGTISLYNEQVVIKSICKPERWTVEELVEFVPKSLAEGLVNPAPPQPSKEK